MIPVKKPTGEENTGILRIPAGITNLACHRASMLALTNKEIIHAFYKDVWAVNK
jgi:hypothetical protein